MKKALVIILCIAMLFSFSACGEHTISNSGLTATMAQVPPAALLGIPKDPTVISKGLAHFLLDASADSMGTDHDKFYNAVNMEVVCTGNYDKADDSSEHTVAFVISHGFTYFGEDKRDIYLAVCRPTCTGGEWVSNLDFESTTHDKAAYAENFMACAQNVFDSLVEITEEADLANDPIILITGHSRGASTANLLGLLCNDWYGTENVYDYTFASPATISSNVPGCNAQNIINFINPADLIPELPTKKWGFYRAGRDVILPDPDNGAEKVQTIINAFALIAPNTASYYKNVYPILAPVMSNLSIGAAASENDGDVESSFGKITEGLPDSLKLVVDGALGILFQHMPDAYSTRIDAMDLK